MGLGSTFKSCISLSQILPCTEFYPMQRVTLSNGSETRTWWNLWTVQYSWSSWHVSQSLQLCLLIPSSSFKFSKIYHFDFYNTLLPTIAQFLKSCGFPLIVSTSCAQQHVWAGWLLVCLRHLELTSSSSAHWAFVFSLPHMPRNFTVTFFEWIV